MGTPQSSKYFAKNQQTEKLPKILEKGGKILSLVTKTMRYSDHADCLLSEQFGSVENNYSNYG